MRKKPLTQDRSLRTKDKLFHAAEELLKECEFEDITIRAIVDRAGVSIGTFYHYYTTKIDVFYETYRMADDYFRETAEPDIMKKTSAFDRIEEFFRAYTYYSADLTSPKMTRLLYNPSNTYFNRDPHQGMVGVLLQVVQEGLDDGSVVRYQPEDTAESIAINLMIAARGLVYNWVTRERSYDLYGAMADYIARMLVAYTPRQG